MATKVMQTPKLDTDIINMPIPTIGETISTNGNGSSKHRTKIPVVRPQFKTSVERKLLVSQIEFRDKAPDYRAHLRTFPWEVGFHEIYDEVRRKTIRMP